MRVVKLLAVVITLGLAVMAWAYAEATSAPVVRRARIALSGWPKSSPPVQIALLSDIHVGASTMDGDRLTRIVEQVNALRPDLVLLAGDFVFGHDALSGARSAAQLSGPLSRLRAPLGVIAVLGNHDHWTDAAAIRAALRRGGVTVLDNDTVRRGTLLVGAVGDAFSGHDDATATLASMRAMGGPGLMLTHTPDLAPELPAGALLLAGHTHCGQVVLPLIGPLVMISPKLGRQLYNPRYRCGLIRDGKRTVVVTAGLGTSGLPFRIGAPPDMWLLTLGGRPAS